LFEINHFQRCHISLLFLSIDYTCVHLIDEGVLFVLAYAKIQNFPSLIKLTMIDHALKDGGALVKISFLTSCIRGTEGDTPELTPHRLIV
jgi:hypothetical protein